MLMFILQYIQTTLTNTKAQGVETLQSQQELIHMAEYLKKQQLEYDEALASLKKKAPNAAKLDQEKLQLQQLSVGLTAELEDYRTQTRRMVADLRLKEEEIGELKHALSERSGAKVSFSVYISVVYLSISQCVSVYLSVSQYISVCLSISQ